LIQHAAVFAEESTADCGAEIPVTPEVERQIGSEERQDTEEEQGHRSRVRVYILVL
jgi:hypothetical protein